MTVDTAPKPNWFSRLAHPGQFLVWTRPLLLPLAIATALCFAVGLWFALFNSPEDYQMGDMVRVMYIHVPNAWLSQLVYGVMSAAALGTLIWRHPLARWMPTFCSGLPTRRVALRQRHRHRLPRRRPAAPARRG